MGKRVLVLMATYNGEKFLKEQLVSIMEQEGVSVDLLVRDDGSSDNTIEILHSFEQMFNKFILLRAPISGRHGPMANYYELIRIAKEQYIENYDYYAFSDQDDIWEKNKLLKSILCMKKEDRPSLVYADYSVIDDKGNLIIKSANDSIGLSFNSRLEILLSHSYAWGHSIVFNNSLFREICINDKIIKSNFPHDAYFAKFASLCGGLYFSNSQLVRYRRYSSNVSGMWYKLSLGKVLKKINIYKESKIYANVVNSTLLTINENKNCKFIDERLIENYFKIISTTGVKTLKMLREFNVKRKQFSRDTNMKMVYSLGIYKRWIGKTKKMENL